MAVVHGQAGIFDVYVDNTEVDRMLDRLVLGMSEASMIAWLREDVSDYFTKDIEGRFASEGDTKSGAWAPLSEATIEIRQELGFGAGPINERTGELKNFVSTGREFLAGFGWAEMQIPGSPPDPVTAAKLEHAQRGAKAIPLKGGGFATAPPRPVLAFDEMDVGAVMTLLMEHLVFFMGSAGTMAAAA